VSGTSLKLSRTLRLLTGVFVSPVLSGLEGLLSSFWLKAIVPEEWLLVLLVLLLLLLTCLGSDLRSRFSSFCATGGDSVSSGRLGSDSKSSESEGGGGTGESLSLLSLGIERTGSEGGSPIGLESESLRFWSSESVEKGLESSVSGKSGGGGKMGDGGEGGGEDLLTEGGGGKEVGEEVGEEAGDIAVLIFGDFKESVGCKEVGLERLGFGESTGLGVLGDSSSSKPSSIDWRYSHE